MSFTAGSSKHLCQRCAGRKARFRYRGVVRADRNHTLCFQCFRSERERLRSRLLAEIPPAMPLKSRRNDPAEETQVTQGTQVTQLRPDQVSHRLRMLAHLERSAR